MSKLSLSSNSRVRDLRVGTGGLVGGGGGGPGPMVSPLEITGCKLWLDAADAASVINTAGAVDQWSDKSGGARHLVATTTARPTTGAATLNGKNVLAFDGGDVMSFAGSTDVNVGTCTIFMVVRETTTGNNGILSLHSGAGNDHDRQDSICNVFGAAATMFETYRYFSGSAGYAHITSAATTPWGIYRSTHNGSTIFAHRNDVLGSPSAGRSGTYTTATGGFVVGGIFRAGAISATNRMIGNIAEIIVYDTVLSAGDVTAVEIYLTTKWGAT